MTSATVAAVRVRGSDCSMELRGVVADDATTHGGLIVSQDKLKLVSEHRCFEGTQRFYRHDSREIGLPMNFSVYIPPQAGQGRVPVLFFLAGLTCTEETFMIKAGAQRM